MLLNRGYKTEIRPSNKQRTSLLKAIGIARKAYNWGLIEAQAEYDSTKKGLSAISLNNRLNKIKKAEFPWMYDVSKSVPQHGLRHLEAAFQNFFAAIKRKAPKANEKYPKLHKKKSGRGSFSVEGAVHITDTHIQLPRVGKVRLKEKGYLPKTGKIFKATVSQKAGRWFVSAQMEVEAVYEPAPKEAVGVDVGIKTLITFMDADFYKCADDLFVCKTAGVGISTYTLRDLPPKIRINKTTIHFNPHVLQLSSSTLLQYGQKENTLFPSRILCDAQDNGMTFAVIFDVNVIDREKAQLFEVQN
jgi:putative transposase